MSALITIVEPGLEIGIWCTIAIILILAVILATSYIFMTVHKPTIYTSNENLQRFLDKHIPCLKDKYWPAWFSPGGISQTCFGLYLRISDEYRLPYRRRILQLADGGQLALDFLGEQNVKTDEKKLVVLILPGLTSCSNTSYIKTLAMAIEATGKSIVAVMSNRGLGGVGLTTPRTYCATNNEDLREVIGQLKKEFPNRKILAIGTSLGGMTLCRYLVDHPEEAKETFIAAMVISICWDPVTANASLEKSVLNRYIVNYTMTSNLQVSLKRHLGMLKTVDCWDFEKILSVKTIRELDHHFTAPQFGYKSAHEYYRACQVTHELHKLTIPVVGINAMDDPLQPGESKAILQLNF